MGPQKMGSKVLAIICLTTVVVNGQRNECEKKRMDYFRCEKKIESDDSLPTLCDKIDAILARCFDVYRECADNEVLEASKQEYITELRHSNQRACLAKSQEMQTYPV